MKININKRYDFPFPLEKVYANWVSSNTVIAPATSMDIPPEVGGHYPLIMDTPEFERHIFNCRGKYSYSS